MRATPSICSSGLLKRSTGALKSGLSRFGVSSSRRRDLSRGPPWPGIRARRYRIETPLARGLLAPEFRRSWSSPPRVSEPFEDFRRVTLGLDLVVDFLDRAVQADDEGGALDAHHLLAVHVLLFIDAVGFGGGPVLVRQQGERQIVLLFEFRLRRWLVRRDPNDRRALLAERLDFVAELAGLHGAARGIGPGIEVQHHALALHCGEPEVFARVRLDVNIGSLIAYVQHASPQFLFE